MGRNSHARFLVWEVDFELVDVWPANVELGRSILRLRCLSLGGRFRAPEVDFELELADFELADFELGRSIRSSLILNSSMLSLGGRFRACRC